MTIYKNTISDLPANWGKPAPRGKSAEREKKGACMYKTGKQHPMCDNRNAVDCSDLGEATDYVDKSGKLHRLCYNCYEHAPNKKELVVKKMSRKKAVIITIVICVIIWLLHTLVRMTH